MTNKQSELTRSDLLRNVEIVQQHRGYLDAATSDNTRRAYRSAIRHFEAWGGCLPTNRDSLIKYLVHFADLLNPRTLDARLTALAQWHQTQGFSDPTQDSTVRKTLKGIRRKHGKPKKKAVALRLEHIAIFHKRIEQSTHFPKKST